jgi:transcription elongation factor GreA
MATLILRDTHRALEEKMESLDKLKKETSLKIRDAASHGDLKEMRNTTLPGRSRV